MRALMRARARGLDDENNVSLSRGKSDSASDIPLSSDRSRLENSSRILRVIENKTQRERERERGGGREEKEGSIISHLNGRRNVEEDIRASRMFRNEKGRWRLPLAA